jgi:hypothetical protein
VEHTKLSRMLSADEAAELGPLPQSDEESPTTDLFETASQATAAVHFPSSAASAPAPAENDTLPDPVSLNGEK